MIWFIFICVVFVQMWPDLIQKANDGGLDAIETYIFWNAHEPQRRQVLIIIIIMCDIYYYWNKHTKLTCLIFLLREDQYNFLGNLDFIKFFIFNLIFSKPREAWFYFLVYRINQNTLRLITNIRLKYLVPTQQSVIAHLRPWHTVTHQQPCICNNLLTVLNPNTQPHLSAADKLCSFFSHNMILVMNLILQHIQL